MQRPKRPTDRNEWISDATWQFIGGGRRVLVVPEAGSSGRRSEADEMCRNVPRTEPKPVRRNGPKLVYHEIEYFKLFFLCYKNSETFRKKIKCNVAMWPAHFDNFPTSAQKPGACASPHNFPAPSVVRLIGGVALAEICVCASASR